MHLRLLWPARRNMSPSTRASATSVLSPRRHFWSRCDTRPLMEVSRLPQEFDVVCLGGGVAGGGVGGGVPGRGRWLGGVGGGVGGGGGAGRGGDSLPTRVRGGAAFGRDPRPPRL